MQFGSSSTAVFFKMRVAGVLHIFQFETRQGEDICMALQTHINDIMMKRYSKVCDSGGKGKGRANGGNLSPRGIPPLQAFSFHYKSEAATHWTKPCPLRPRRWLRGMARPPGLLLAAAARTRWA